LEFRRLSPVAVSLILGGNVLRCWSENDIFLAITQWAAFPLHSHLPSMHALNGRNGIDSNGNDNGIGNDNGDVDAVDNGDSDNVEVNIDGHRERGDEGGRFIENPSFCLEDNRMDIVCRRFDAVQDSIRYHLMDPWFMDIVVKHYPPLQRNAKAILRALRTSTKSSCCQMDSNFESNPRLHDVIQFLEKSKPIRAMPGSLGLHSRNHNRNEDNDLNTNHRGVGRRGVNHMDPREDQENRHGLRIMPNFQSHYMLAPGPLQLGRRAPPDQRDVATPLPPRRGVPRQVSLENEGNGQRGDWESLTTRKVSNRDLYRRTQEYDQFMISFKKSDLMNLQENGRRTAEQLMVWRGIKFALDIVRKRNDVRLSDSVGVFLYSQGLDGCSDKEHIWVRYSLQTNEHDTALQCTSYKKMHLNFKKGNGSKDFFDCSWATFLRESFDPDDMLRFKLTFIDAK